MIVGNRVQFTAADRHKLRPSLGGLRGTVKLVATGAPEGGQREVYVEFDRDSHVHASNGWWISPSHLVRV